MSTVLKTLLTSSVAVGNGSPMEVRGWTNLSFQVTGIVSGDKVKIQGSNDDFETVSVASLSFSDIPEEITADGIYWLDQPTPAIIRAIRSAQAGSPGTVNVKMVGERGD